MPYFLTPGNHDLGPGGGAGDRSTLLNDHFQAADNPLNDPVQGGIPQGFFEPNKLENTYSTLSKPDGRKLLVFLPEFAPWQRVANWANEIADRPEYQDHSAVLLTHANMLEDDADVPGGEPNLFRSDHANPDDPVPYYNPHACDLAKNLIDSLDEVRDGEQLWDELISQHGNFEMALNGHYLDRNYSNTPEGDRRLRRLRPTPESEASPSTRCSPTTSNRQTGATGICVFWSASRRGDGPGQDLLADP